MHHNQNDDPDTGKPEIIEFYNHTKGGVEGLDFKCANYSSNRRTKKLPMAVVLYTIVDVASGVNALVIASILHRHFKKNHKNGLYERLGSVLGPSSHAPETQQRTSRQGPEILNKKNSRNSEL